MRCTAAAAAALVAVLIAHAPAACHCGQILGMAMVGAFSHQLQVLKVGQELAQRGHTFAMLLTSTEQVSLDLVERKRFPGMKIELIEGTPGFMTPAQRTEQDPDLVHDPVRLLRMLGQDIGDAALCIVRDKAALERLRKTGYDVLIRDAGFWPGAALQELLGIPGVGLWPMPILQPAGEGMFGIKASAAYVRMFPLTGPVPKSLWGRLKNLATGVFTKTIIMPHLYSGKARFMVESGLFLEEIKTQRPSTAVTMITNDWSAMNTPQPLPPRNIMVGPVTIDPPTGKLPDEIAAFLDQGQPVIYVSMGTSVRLSVTELKSMVAGLSNMSTPVLWKLGPWDLPGNLTLAQMQFGSNIKVVEWVPQCDVLAHPAVDVFVTQGGMCSMQETMALGVKTLVVPIGGDQPMNAAQAELHGFGLQLSPKELDSSRGGALVTRLTRLLTEPSFQANADKVARRMWRPYPARATAADVVERVMHTGGERYLDTAEHELTWYQRSMLDVYAAISAVLAAVLALLGWLGWGLSVRLWRLLSKQQPKAKVH